MLNDVVYLCRSPCFSVATNILIVVSPTVSSLVVRRLLMPFSSTPWHSGEAAALADMFKHDPDAYSVAKSRIEIVSSIMQIVCPLVGARLAETSLRLPWAICGVSFAMMIVVAYKCVHNLRHRIHDLQRLHARQLPDRNPADTSRRPCRKQSGFRSDSRARILCHSSSCLNVARRCSCWRYLR